MTKTRSIRFSRKRRKGGRKTVKRRGGRRRSRVTKRRGGRRRSRVRSRGGRRSRRVRRGGVAMPSGPNCKTIGSPQKIEGSALECPSQMWQTWSCSKDGGIRGQSCV